jgi:hypothetical protein
MDAVKVGSCTPVVVVEIGSWVARIGCHCFVYFQRYYLMLPHCHLGIVVVSQTGHPVEPYWLSLVEIHSLTSYVNTGWS